MQINGLVLGKYHIEKLINNGSFASVFQAKEELTNRTVAIKTLSKSVYPVERLRYLLTELSAMGLNWGHPNIVSIHTVEPGNDEYVAYIVMEYIDGPSLRRLMVAKPPSPNLAINIALDICRGLIAAHEHNIIHRDIKPQNILMTSDHTAKIADFGVARILEATTDYAGTITGTRKYMAPEQYEGSYDYRADLYSTGLILYEMFMGKFPFRGKTHDEIQMRKQSEGLELSSQLPKELCTILQKALHRDMEMRYRTAAEMYNDLDGVREKWYQDVARKTILQHPNPSIQWATLSKYREELRVSADAAEKIELGLRDEQEKAAKKQEERKLQARANVHYNQALQQLDATQAKEALLEMRQAHRLYLTDVEATRKADRIFRNLSELIVPPQPPSTARDLVERIVQLPVDEMSELKAWFYDQFPPSGVSQPEDTDVSLIDSYTGSDRQPKVLNPQEPAPEFVLQKLHETVQNAHEILAAEICRSAEKYAQVGKSRRARGKYNKLGEFYRKSAARFIKAENWELLADCYVRARLAYLAAHRSGRARQSAQEAGNYYVLIAHPLELRGEWAEAGRLYTLSAEHYAHANLSGEADESRLRATICYFNAAENARAAGDINLSYEYCDKILTISKKMQRASNAVAGARKLMKEIEAFFFRQAHE